MKKSNPKKSLKSLSWTYIVLAVLVILVMVGFALIPDVASKFTDVTGDKDTFLVFEITLGINVVAYLWYFWLARRVASGKSKGTFYMVLLMLGVIGGIVSFVSGQTKAVASIDFVVDIVALYFMYQIRQEESK